LVIFPRQLSLALRAKTEKCDVHSVDLEPGALLEFLIEVLQRIVGDLASLPTIAADQMVVSTIGNLINQLSITDMRRQDQTLFGQETQGAVDRGLS
jgi:hypothetical protein